MKIDGVEWRAVTINGESTPYIASEFGNIMNIETNHMMTASPLQQSGRPRVCLHYNGKKKDIVVYRVIYEAFHGPIPKDMTVDHIDGNFNNNCISNLQLLSASENIKKFYRDNPDKGFAKIYTEEQLIKFYKLLKKGLYYRIAGERVGINPDSAKNLAMWKRRKDLWKKYQPFPNSALFKIDIDKNIINIISSMLIDGKSTKEILDAIGFKYCLESINMVSRIRTMLNLKNPKTYDQSTLIDIDKMILDGNSNDEIYKALGLSSSDSSNQDLLYRRRKKLSSPNPNNCKVGDPNELKMISKYISEGLSTNEILHKIDKPRSQYYINTISRLRSSYKKKMSSTTIESTSIDGSE